jgi:O-antigen/teichoic acid export membrane protein
VLHSGEVEQLFHDEVSDNQAERFPIVKLLSRYVMPASSGEGVPARIVFKAAADAGGKAVTLVVTMAAARTLMPDAFGVLALGMATGWLLGIATDAGLSMYLARETARHPDRARALASEVMTIRTATAYAAAALIALFVSRFVPSHWRLQFVLVVLAQLTSAVLDTLYHWFRGLERSEIESAIHLSQRGVTVALAFAVLWWQPRLDYLGAALLAPPLIALAIAAVIARCQTPFQILRTEEKFVPEAQTSERYLTPSIFLRDVLPLGAATLISALYFRCDLFFIERWHGLEAVGAYNAVFRLIEAMRLLPAAVMAVTFPILCRAVDTRLVLRIGGGLAAVGMVLVGLTVLMAPAIVRTVYGVPYENTAPTLTVLALALPFFFLNYALTHQVIGWDGQRAYLRIVSLALIANILANLWLVPQHGITGAAIATVLTELVVTAGCVHALWGTDRLPTSAYGLRRLQADVPEARSLQPEVRGGGR